LLCNLYLHRLDRAWQTRGVGCWWATPTMPWCVPHPAAGRTRACGADGGPGRAWPCLKQAKTRIVHLEQGGEGLDFLGFHIAGCAPKRHVIGMSGSLPVGLGQGDAACP
jgi:RNA-directed DNA polymerase